MWEQQMPREVYVLRDGKLVPKHEAESFFRAPGVIRDQMAPLRHMANGVVVDSKSEFRQITKAHGLEEVGTSASTPNKRHSDHKAIVNAAGRALQMVRDGYKPNPQTVAGAGGDGWL